jgi:Zn-dependent M28 family amino/carboxypeptidase
LLAAFGKYATELSATYGGGDPASDHGPFAAAGFNSALLIEAEPVSPVYHKKPDAATDEDGKDMVLDDGTAYLDYAYATRMTRVGAGWLAETAVMADPPADSPAPRAPLKPL